MPDSDKITSLGEFVCRVGEIREDWRVDTHKELWFRGEGQKHEKSLLRPQLYRPPNGRAMKSVPELLKIENDLYEYFQRCGVQLCDQKPGEAEWDWDWYFLMQHHGAATRLLDWSDGALMALHFALRDKTNDALRDEANRNLPNPVVYVLEPDRLEGV
jgi:FRG domain